MSLLIRRQRAPLILLGLALLSGAQQARAENRAIVFGGTCADFEKSANNDVHDFAAEEIPQLDALKNAGWDVHAYYGGSTVRCNPAADKDCKPAPYGGRVDEALKTAKSSFTPAQVGEASAANFKQALRDAANGMHSGDHLFLSVVTHGDMNGFCSSTDYITYRDPELNKLLDQLKKRGVVIGYSASHCFSGGGVDQWSKYGCVVSIASATTVGLEGNPQITELLNHVDSKGKAVPPPDAKVSMEDLFLARLFSPNAMEYYRDPEISGFTPGNQLNNVLTDKMFPGNKYDLKNDFLIQKYFENAAGFGSGSLDCKNSCCEDSANVAMATYMQYLQDFEGIIDASDADQFRGLIDRFYGRQIDFSGLGQDPSFLKETQALLLDYEKNAQAFREMSQTEKDMMSRIEQAKVSRFDPDMSGIALPGTENLMAQAVKEKLEILQRLQPDADGKLSDPMQFSGQFLSASSTQQRAKDIYNAYVHQLFSITAPTDAHGKPDPHFTPPVTIAGQNQAALIAQIQKRLEQAQTASLKNCPELMETLRAIPNTWHDTNQALSKLNAEESVIKQKLSGHFAVVLAKQYENYKKHLESGSNLTAKEQSDKAQLEACQNFQLYKPQ